MLILAMIGSYMTSKPNIQRTGYDGSLASIDPGGSEYYEEGMMIMSMKMIMDLEVMKKLRIVKEA